MRGASLRWYNSSAWSRRARKTGEGRPRYSAAPSTRITSAGCASSRTLCCSMRLDRNATATSKPMTASAIVFQMTLFMCAMLTVSKKHHCKQMLTPETITSAANPLLKEVRRAVARGSLTEGGCCVAETFHLLEEALRSGYEVKTVLAAESARAAVVAQGRRLAGVKVVVLPDALFAGIAATETSQGVIALVQPRPWKLEQLLPGGNGQALVVVLDGLQDPGNAGAIVRAAEAFGATGVLFLKGTVSPHNPKTLRASAGSLFRVPYLHGLDSAAARAALEGSRIGLFAAMPAASATSLRPLAATDLTGRCALIVGNEAHGVSAVWRPAPAPVLLPTPGGGSLNAAPPARLLLYEARRQRMLRP